MEPQQHTGTWALDLVNNIYTAHPPLKCELNDGESLGLNYPIIYGWRPEFNLWMAWDRHTGFVHAFAPSEKGSEFETDFGKYRVKKFATPESYNEKDNFKNDSVS